MIVIKEGLVRKPTRETDIYAFGSVILEVCRQEVSGMNKLLTRVLVHRSFQQTGHGAPSLMNFPLAITAKIIRRPFLPGRSASPKIL